MNAKSSGIILSLDGPDFLGMTRNHILGEIRRIVLANNGKVPGKLAFLRETGIKESDWSGKLWARWSDAIKEAGFTPNQLQEGYQKEEVIRNVIALIRELGHFPVTSELRLKARSTPGFPNDKTIEKHLGSKAARCAQIAEYCRVCSGYEDVLAICALAPIASASERNRQKELGGSLDDSLGFVYLLRAGNYFKIGRTNAVGRRERELAIQLPERVLTVHEIKTDDPLGIEAYWHKRFNDKRKNGEWFALNAEDVKAFRRRKFM